jgi:hypothetical protein
MNDDDRFDFSALDPMRDPEHWREVVATTLGRVDAALDRRTADPLATIVGWKRPLLIAAAVAVALLVPVELALELREPRAEQVQRLVSLSIDWGGDDPPSGAAFLRALAAEEP